MYSFFSLNVARLLQNNSVNKSKINFLNDLSDESTLFVALCETFLNDNIFDAEIQMQGFNVCRTDRLLKDIMPNVKTWWWCMFLYQRPYTIFHLSVFL